MLETTSITLTPQSREQNGLAAKSASTPSPNAVQDFRNTTITDSNASDIVSNAIFEQLDLDVVVTDSEVIEYSSALTLPELTEVYEQAGCENDINSDEHDIIEDEITNRCPSRASGGAKKESITTISIGQRMLQQALSSLATPVPPATEFITQINVGHERQVTFHTQSLGIRLNRGIDGYVRIVSASTVDDDQVVREGDIYAGDVVREVNDVDLRMPIDMAIWKMTISMMKMAVRPLRIVLAEELADQGSDIEEINTEYSSSATSTHHIDSQSAESKKSRSATRAFMHLMKCPSAVDTNESSNKRIPPSLEELSEEHLTSIELDHSRDAFDDFDECRLTPSQINNLL